LSVGKFPADCVKRVGVLAGKGKELRLSKKKAKADL